MFQHACKQNHVVLGKRKLRTCVYYTAELSGSAHAYPYDIQVVHIILKCYGRESDLG